LRASKTPQDKPLFLDKKLNVVKLNSTTRNFESLSPFLLKGLLSLFHGIIKDSILDLKSVIQTTRNLRNSCWSKTGKKLSIKYA